MKMSSTRREFLKHSLATSTALSVGFAAGSTSWAGPSPNEKLNIAAVGTAARAASDIRGCASENIVALCDVDAGSLEKAAGVYQGSRTYKDFRVMLEKEAGKIDAVIVGTPDHCHAPAAAMVMKLGKHVYCEKPLTHTVYESRVLANLAKEKNLVTQMGNQIHAGNNYRRVVELVQSGTIGAVKEAHVWSGSTYQGGKFVTTKPKPSQLDWDLWLGPAPKRSYVEATVNGKPETVHPFHWRWFWDYGTGSLGDFGCHYMDLAHWALNLKHPTSIVATGPKVLPEATTAGLIVKYKYPARENMPPVSLTWYDGGKRPAILASLKDASGKPLNWSSGQLFVGEKGMVISNYGQHHLLPNSGEELTRPEPFIPNSIGHHKEWVNAIKTNGPTTCNFDYAGALTEAVMLGVVAYRSGEPLEWDAANVKVTNSSAAQDLIHKEYRNGWTL